MGVVPQGFELVVSLFEYLHLHPYQSRPEVPSVLMMVKICFKYISYDFYK
jgi:hypothetical protein